MTNNLEQRIEDIKDEECVTGEFDGNVEIKPKIQKPNFSGQIDSMEMVNIDIEYNPEYEEEGLSYGQV